MYIPEFEKIEIKINNARNKGFYKKLINKEVEYGEIYNIHWSLLQKSSHRRDKIKVKCDECGEIFSKELRSLKSDINIHYCIKCYRNGERNPIFGKPQHPNTAKGIKKFLDEYGNPFSWESSKQKIKEKRKFQVMNKGWHHSEDTRKKMSVGIRLAYKEGRKIPSIRWGTSKMGFYKNLGYQSSYELKFLKYCEERGILDQIERGPKIQYKGLDESMHTYFVDYKLKNSKKIFEIKSSYIYNKRKKENQLKQNAASKLYDYYLIMDNNFKNLNI
jgi:hypothetical protein